MKSSSHITSENLILRAVEPSDIDFLYLAENDTDAWSSSATVAPMSRLLLQQYIEQYHADLYGDRQLRLIAVHPISGEPIGIADLYDYDPRNSRAGVGIYIAPKKRSQGFGTLALQLLCDYAQDFIGIHNLYAIIAEENRASRHIFDKCGFAERTTLPHWLKTSHGYTSAVLTMRIK